MDQEIDAFNIRSFRQSDTEAVVHLWRVCGLVTRTNDPVADIQRKRRVDPQWFLVGLVGHQLVATCMAGYEGHRGWINYLAVAPRFRRRGFATCLMAEAERRLAAAGCPKINLQVRDTNTEVLRFYRRIGYVQDPVVSLGKRLIEDKV